MHMIKLITGGSIISSLVFFIFINNLLKFNVNYGIICSANDTNNRANPKRILKLVVLYLTINVSRCASKPFLLVLFNQENCCNVIY